MLALKTFFITLGIFVGLYGMRELWKWLTGIFGPETMVLGFVFSLVWFFIAMRSSSLERFEK